MISKSFKILHLSRFFSKPQLPRIVKHKIFYLWCFIFSLCRLSVCLFSLIVSVLVVSLCVDLWYRDGHCARLLRLPDIPSGHIVVSKFCVCSQCLVIECCDLCHGSSETINRVSSITLSRTCTQTLEHAQTHTHERRQTRTTSLTT